MGEQGVSGAGRKTMKEMALEALSEHPDGLEARAILAWIKGHYGLDLPKESFSPQLSRLAQAGAIMRNGLVWRLAAFGELGAAPGASQRGGDAEAVDP